MRKKFVEWRLIDGARLAAGTMLVDHLKEWHGYLLAKGNTEKHADISRNRVLRIIEGCGFTFHADISAAKVAQYLHASGVGKSSYNHYLTAFKGFCLWMCKDGRTSLNPVAYLAKVNAATDIRRQRRVLTAEEIKMLFETTHNGPTRYRLTGPERCLLYLLGLLTGLRASEIASLRLESFDLTSNPPVVVVGAAYSKHKGQDTLPLSDAVVGLLKPFLASMKKGQHLFDMRQNPRTGKMMKEDLAAARARWVAETKTEAERNLREKSDFLLYKDSSGRFADFHAMRHGFGTYLAASGAHPKVAQSLMRHSTINLTMSRYSHVLQGQESEAVSKLPSFIRSNISGDERTGTGG